MAVNSFREDEQVKSQGKWKVIVRLFSYLKDHIKGVIGALKNSTLICFAYSHTKKSR